MTLKILGTGMSLPATCRLSSELDFKHSKKPGWFEGETGVTSRYVVSGENQIDMGVAAARDAIQQAGLQAGDIDLIISACGIAYQTLPATAPLYQRQLGIADGKAAAFDINSTCLSFISALEMVAALLSTGRYKRALIISSEIATRALPWQSQPEIAGLFGDGAAAVVVEYDQCAYLEASFQTYPSAYEACQIAAGGTRFDFQNEREAFEAHAQFAMDGKALFKITSKHFNRFVSALLQKAGWRESDVDVVIPHQASPFALAHLIRQCGFSTEQVVDISRTHGNQIAASIPTALHIARQTGRVPHGAKVLMLGTSAGVSFGGITMIA
jgi:3-oxoacyl-[acyl-carrier-protein] synthase III